MYPPEDLTPKELVAEGYKPLDYETEGAILYYARCGWCGAYEGTVSPSEPCAIENGEYIGPHQFGVFERKE